MDIFSLTELNIIFCHFYKMYLCAGDMPYPNIKGRDLPAMLESGYRMNKPDHLSTEMYDIF